MTRAKELATGRPRGPGWSNWLGTHPDDKVAIFWIKSTAKGWQPNRSRGVLHYRLRNDEVEGKSLCNQGDGIRGKILAWTNHEDQVKLRTVDVCASCLRVAKRIDDRVRAQARTQKFLQLHTTTTNTTDSDMGDHNG